jgi:hypothetical protein
MDYQIRTPATNSTKPPRLLDQVRAAIRMKHYSQRTEEAYVHWTRHFILFHGKRHLVEMGEPDVGQFLKHLALNKRVAASTQNQALNALLFLYSNVLKNRLANCPTSFGQRGQSDCLLYLDKMKLSDSLPRSRGTTV